MFDKILKQSNFLLIELATDFYWQPINQVGENIKIGLEHAHFVVMFYFFLIWTCKKLVIMGPNNTKNSSLQWDFLIFNYE